MKKVRYVMALLMIGLGACVASVDPADEGPTAEAEEELSQPCGKNICGKGTYCCNASCGTCAPLGGYCTQQICPPTM